MNAYAKIAILLGVILGVIGIAGTLIRPARSALESNERSLKRPWTPEWHGKGPVGKVPAVTPPGGESMNVLQVSATPDEDFEASANETRIIVSPGLREEMTRRVMQAWADSDPAAALAWAARLPEPGEAEIAMTQVCAQVAETGPATAIRLALSHQLDGIPGDLIGNLAAGWAARDLSGMFEWVCAQPDDGFRNQMMERMVFQQAQSDPEGAARLVAERMNEGDNQTEAVISVLHQWALKDPAAATAWVGLFPGGALRDRAASELGTLRSNHPAGANK